MLKQGNGQPERIARTIGNEYIFLISQDAVRNRQLKNNVFCLLIRQSFVIFVKMKTADGTFRYGHCRDMEDSYSAWKQAEIDIHIVRSLNVLE